jgi:hypothetical protein
MELNYAKQHTECVTFCRVMLEDLEHSEFL